MKQNRKSDTDCSGILQMLIIWMKEDIFLTIGTKLKDLHYPRNIKKIFFLTKKEDKDKDWRYIETQNAFEKNNGKIYLMDGSHYIFRDNFMKMSQIIRESF